VYSDPATLAWQCHSNLFIYNNNNNNNNNNKKSESLAQIHTTMTELQHFF